MPKERLGKVPLSRKAIAAIVVAAFPFCFWVIVSGTRQYQPEYALGLFLLISLITGLLALSALIDSIEADTEGPVLPLSLWFWLSVGLCRAFSC